MKKKKKLLVILENELFEKKKDLIRAEANRVDTAKLSIFASVTTLVFLILEFNVKMKVIPPSLESFTLTLIGVVIVLSILYPLYKGAKSGSKVPDIQIEIMEIERKIEQIKNK